MDRYLLAIGLLLPHLFVCFVLIPSNVNTLIEIQLIRSDQPLVCVYGVYRLFNILMQSEMVRTRKN